MKKEHEFATRAIHAGQEPDPSTGAVITPIYATSTYVQESPGKHKGYDYARSINPTRLAYEKCIADLESGSRGFAFASGLAAMATVLELVESGSHIVASDDLYGGTFRSHGARLPHSCGRLLLPPCRHTPEPPGLTKQCGASSSPRYVRCRFCSASIPLAGNRCGCPTISSLRNPAAAVLVFFPATAGTRFVAADLWN
jgi:hypothetical protein